ncbi:MAG: hypothetical protein H6840_06965 [Planctomycetes bacterium]|nr:hypothetical protein [Planctomycetota bacterium]
MRYWFLLVAVAFSTALAAQPTPGLAITTVIHEPTAGDVGPYISGLTIPNPFYDPLQPNGQPATFPVYGNGKGIDNELDSISDEFYALGNTTTHDLAIVLNTTGAPITVDSTTIVLAGERPRNDVSAAPEQSSPDGSAPHTIYPYDAVSVTIPDGSAVALFLIVSKWRDSLDTSPREYIWTFTFDDTGATTYTVEGDLLVPKVGGDSGSGCATSNEGYPQGLWILAAGGIAAITTRRKLLKKA